MTGTIVGWFLELAARLRLQLSSGARYGVVTTRRRLAPALLALLVSAPLLAQTPPAAVPKPAAEPPLRRWFELQQLTVFSRYRFIENNKDVTTSSQQQYKDSVRARVNLDSRKRYTVNVGFFSGSTFASSWNNLGLGNNTVLDGKSNFIKQLYASAIPVRGLELQYGGLYVSRGESDEWDSYDDDGYMVGERVSVRRPKELYLDEITVTRGAMGPLATANLAKRWDGLKNPDYTQVLGVKRFNPVLSASLEYDRQIGDDILRAAVTLRFSAKAPISTMRYEQYRRLTLNPAAGFVVWAERPVTKYARLQGGYATVDQFYGGWNADRMQSGRRFFANATIPIYGPISGTLYVTRALDAPYAVSIHRRFDAVISYDVLNTLRRTGIF